MKRVWLPALVLCACSGSPSAPALESAPDAAAPDSAQQDASQEVHNDATLDSATDESAGDALTEDAAESLCGFRVTIEPGSRLVIAAPDGRVLLDGLAPGAIGSDEVPDVGFAVRDQSTSYEMMFGSFKPTVTNEGPWRVATQLAESKTPDGKAIELSDGTKLARLVFDCPQPGHLRVQVEPGDGPERRLSWAFGCSASDHFAGFGAQTWDVDHRGQTVPTWVQEEGIGKIETDDYSDLLWYLEGRRHSSHLPIPQYLARRGYILTAQSDARSIFAMCSEKDDLARVEVDMPLAIHLFDGPTPAQALERATAEFGRPRMPPQVAFAPWLDAIYGRDNVLAVAQQARDESVPASVIWTEDWRGGHASMTGYDLDEEWEFDTTLYPDPATMTAQLHDSGYAFFVYFNPFVFQGTKAWSDTQPQGWLIRNANDDPYTFQGATLVDTASMLDVTHPQARAWAVAKMKDAIALGADGWMLDFAEWLPTDAKLHGGSGMQWHNRYPVVWQEIAREAIDGVNDGQQRMFFARSGWFGTPGLADCIWAGDQRTTFDRDDGMPILLPIGIGLGLVGVSTYGHDIAGYAGATNGGSTKELFFRWTELGAWSPVMRTHHGASPDKNWAWNKDAETIEHFRRYARLHMALVPLWEGLARVAADTGLPIWRGMAVAFPEDEKVWPIDDQVMVGDGLMLAPVQEAGAVSRSVYLPEGLWFSWEGVDAIGGPVTVQAAAPVAEIPVYARAGTIVPMYPDGVMTVVHGSAAVPDPSTVGDARIVNAFLGANGSFREASGLTYSMQQLETQWYGELSFAWNGSVLAACGAPPCVDASPHLASLQVKGPGVAEVREGTTVVARIEVKGGDAGRALNVRIRH